MDWNLIKAVVFDAYGTLLNINFLDARLHHYFGEKASDISEVWRRKQLEYTWLRTLMQCYMPFSTVTAEALKFACNELSMPLKDEVLEDMMHRYFELSAYPEVPEVLEKLSNKHKLSILSNADLPMLKSAVQYNKIEHCLAEIISADQIKKFKPVSEVYKLATEILKLEKEQIAFVSANSWDIAGAKSFGLATIWLNRKGSNMEKLGFAPDAEIEKLDVLRDVL
jgi:2-haloacid dehalogenase